ncbi:MAG: hypothetical protein WKF73_03000 [Nocardioidaceae bacterium]
MIDGASALPEMEKAIRMRNSRSISPAGTRALDFELTRGPGALPLRDLLAEVAERVPVRLLLWAGRHSPALRPTRLSGPTADRIGVWPDSVQVSGGGLFMRLPTGLAVWLSSGLQSVGHRDEAWLEGDCPARSSTAHLAVLIGTR